MISKRQRFQMKSQRCLHGSYLNRVDFSSFLEKDVSFNRRLKIEVRIYISGRNMVESEVGLYPGLLEATCKTENGK